MLLTVIHRRLPDRSTMLKVSAGWHMHLDVLVARASRRGAGAVLGRLEPPAEGIRPAAAGLTPQRRRRSRYTANRRSAMQALKIVSATGVGSRARADAREGEGHDARP